MAEVESQNAIVRAEGQIDTSYQLKIKEFSAAGGSDTFTIAVPQDDPKWREVLIRAGFLKKGVMRDQDFGSIACAILYADSFGLNALAGDVYIVSGRLATTADAKIRHALGSGVIEGYEVEIEEGPEVTLSYQLKGKPETWRGKELYATVTVHVKGWKTPVTYEATLSEWFEGQNPNWRSRPKFMLRKNALSKALAEVAPLGVEADEAPPLPPAQVQQDELEPLLKRSIEEAKAKKEPARVQREEVEVLG